jgi:hypothetical protein
MTYSKYQKCSCLECLRFTRSEWLDVLRCIAGALVVGVIVWGMWRVTP